MLQREVCLPAQVGLLACSTRWGAVLVGAWAHGHAGGSVLGRHAGCMWQDGVLQGLWFAWTMVRASVAAAGGGCTVCTAAARVSSSESGPAAGRCGVCAVVCACWLLVWCVLLVTQPVKVKEGAIIAGLWLLAYHGGTGAMLWLMHAPVAASQGRGGWWRAGGVVVWVGTTKRVAPGAATQGHMHSEGFRECGWSQVLVDGAAAWAGCVPAPACTMPGGGRAAPCVCGCMRHVCVHVQRAWLCSPAYKGSPRLQQPEAAEEECLPNTHTQHQQQQRSTMNCRCRQQHVGCCCGTLAPPQPHPPGSLALVL